MGAVGTVADSDYADATEVVITGLDVRSPEQWARATFEGAPLVVRSFIVGGWVAALGLRLGPRPSPDHILGWTIETATDEVVVLGVHSSVLGPAHLALRVKDSHVVLATFLRFERRPGRSIWWAAAPLHRRIVRYLLEHAASPTGFSCGHAGDPRVIGETGGLPPQRTCDDE
jgi:hypothetical protein